MTDYITIDSPDNLLRLLWNEQGRHLASFLTPPDWNDWDPNLIYISDDTLDYIDSATRLFALLTDFLHFDRDITELYPMLLIDPADKEITDDDIFSIAQLAGDGRAPIFDIFPCTNY